VSIGTVARYHLDKISTKSPRNLQRRSRRASSLPSRLLLNPRAQILACRGIHPRQLQAPPALSRLRPCIHLERKGTTVTWGEREPTLQDILSDPITKEVMKADGVDSHPLSAMLKAYRRNYRMLRSSTGRLLMRKSQSVCHCRRYGRDWLRSMERVDRLTCRRSSARSGH
jgi:hypothetical protein